MHKDGRRSPGVHANSVHAHGEMKRLKWQDGSSENEGVMLAEWLSHLEKQVVPKMLRQ